MVLQSVLRGAGSLVMFKSLSLSLLLFYNVTTVEYHKSDTEVLMNENKEKNCIDCCDG